LIQNKWCYDVPGAKVFHGATVFDGTSYGVSLVF